MSRPFSGDPDPLVYLVPLVGSMGVSSVWPAFEHFMNVLVSWLALALVLGVIVVFAWQLWGPLPGTDRRRAKWAQRQEESTRA